jgi:oxygen-dependent protoporphyrinogen oxidase
VTVLVVGGGITGLASAYALGKAGVPTLLLEGSPRLGGKVWTETVDGFVIEHGPDSFVSYRAAGLALCRELGLGDAIIRPQEPRTVFVRSRGRFLRFPDGMGLVLPTKFGPFVTSELFSPLEKLRMGLDLVLPRDRRAADIAVGPFLRRRLGRALVDRLAGPLIGGVYGTPIDQLSLDAVVPQLREAERVHRSLLLAALADARARGRVANVGTAAEGRPSPRLSPFVTLTGGTQQLVDALVEAVRSMPSVEIRQDTAVVSLELDGHGATVRIRGGQRLHGEAAILAAPAFVTAALLESPVPEAARQIRAIPHGSTAVVNLAYRDDQLPDELPGHGFLVAGDEPLSISACTLSSRKWAGRAPDGTLLVRAFIGATRSGADMGSDEALVAAAHADVAGTIGIRGLPMLTRVSRYPGAMPHYTVGHLDRVAATEAALAPFPALRVAGGAYRGVGLPDCIGQGQAAADAVAAFLGGADRNGRADNGLAASAGITWLEGSAVSEGRRLPRPGVNLPFG